MKKAIYLVFFCASLAQASLINPGPSGSPQPAPSQSVAQLQAIEKIKIHIAANQTFRQLKRTVNLLFTEVWNNPKGLTPQQAFDALGTDAGQLHSLFIGTVALLNAASPGAVNLTEPHTVTVNPDGTVTVGP